MDLHDILSKALGIADNKKFIVEFYEKNDTWNDYTDTKELTYLQLGTYLITNAEGIERIKVYNK